MTKEEEYELYAEVSKQLAQGKRDEGVWTKAFVDSEGDINKTEAIYIGLMVEKLVLKKKSELETKEAVKRNREARRPYMHDDPEIKRLALVRKKFPKTLFASYVLIPGIAFLWWFFDFEGGLLGGIICGIVLSGLVIFCLEFSADPSRYKEWKKNTLEFLAVLVAVLVLIFSPLLLFDFREVGEFYKWFYPLILKIIISVFFGALVIGFFYLVYIVIKTDEYWNSD